MLTPDVAPRLEEERGPDAGVRTGDAGVEVDVGVVRPAVAVGVVRPPAEVGDVFPTMTVSGDVLLGVGGRELEGVVGLESVRRLGEELDCCNTCH
jgi:hypothetical protein